jgi:hypothetical protein
MITFAIIYDISDYILCNKIRLVAFVISNILGHSNLCHLSCDFYDYALEKKRTFITIIMIYN